jgi:hypothetical protein
MSVTASHATTCSVGVMGDPSFGSSPLGYDDARTPHP